jgi:ABC-type transport system involved in multi-copper enzyme maturation permease subunit
MSVATANRVNPSMGASNGRGPAPGEFSQAVAVGRLEIWRNFLGLRAIFLYLVAGFPVFIAAVSAFVRLSGMTDESLTAGGLSTEYAAIFNQLVVRVIFFVCLIIFTRLFQTEIQQRSLHYYFLAPLRRGVIVAGKFGAGLVAAAVLMGVAVTASYLLFMAPLMEKAGSASFTSFVLAGSGLAHLFGYLGVMLLAVLGYGALFLAIGLYFNNPIVPAVLLFAWESLNTFLPPVLKQFSVIYYLSALQPVPVPEGLFALLSEPPNPWLAALGLLVFATLMVVVSTWKVKRLEIHYGDE